MTELRSMRHSSGACVDAQVLFGDDGDVAFQGAHGVVLDFDCVALRVSQYGRRAATH